MNKIIPSVIEDNGEYYIHMEEYKKVKELGEQYKLDYEKEKYLVDKLTRQLTDEYKNTEKQTEKAEHYKHLYSEVKKQKDDVVEYIKNNSLYEEEYDYDYEENPYLSRISDEQARTDLLRMLGEIDVKD